MIETILVIYAIGLIAIGIFDAKKVTNFDDYACAGRNRNSLAIGASLLASVVGASATMGVVSLAYKSGGGAFWWLGSGAIGLILLGFLLASKLVNQNVYTLADLVEKVSGSQMKFVISAVVVIGWTGITAAQYVAVAKIISNLSGLDYSMALLLAGGFVSLYCTLGGQASVLKTDFLQAIFMLGGLLLTLFFLYNKTGVSTNSWNIDLFSGGFNQWAYFMVVVGSGFLIGPDVFSRIFVARSSKDAKRGAIGAGIVLAFMSIIIVSIGLWAQQFITVPDGTNALLYIMNNELPNWLGLILILALLSAIISSADTCLITASTTFEHNILAKSRVGGARKITFILGVIAMLIAWQKADIIGTLLLTYSIFNCGVIPPLLVSLIASSRQLNKNLLTIAVIAGAGLGVYSSLAEIKWVAILGMGVSLSFSLLAMMPISQKQSSAVYID